MKQFCVCEKRFRPKNFCMKWYRKKIAELRLKIRRGCNFCVSWNEISGRVDKPESLQVRIIVNQILQLFLELLSKYSLIL